MSFTKRCFCSWNSNVQTFTLEFIHDPSRKLISPLRTGELSLEELLKKKKLMQIVEKKRNLLLSKWILFEDNILFVWEKVVQ